ncbi:MAG: DUF2877 domain-containing protein [Actinomycetota bacterium]
MRALLAGEGAAAVLAASAPTRPTGWWRFSRSAIVEVGGGVVVLVSPGTPLGPLEVLVDDLPRSPEGLEALTLDGVPHWQGGLPEPSRLARAIGVAGDAAALAAEGTLVPAGRWGAALGAMARGDLAAAVSALGGAGPGLTPAGDDALGGLFFALRARLGPGAEGWLSPLAAGVETTALSSGALRWAARGQALAPAHGLLGAAVAGNRRAAEGAALALARIGHSSGADFALGLAAGLRLEG